MDSTVREVSRAVGRCCGVEKAETPCVAVAGDEAVGPSPVKRSADEALSGA